MEKKEKEIISKQRKWFSNFLYLPAILCGLVAVSGVVEGIYCCVSLPSNLIAVGLLVIFIATPLLAYLTFAITKIICSYYVLHIYYTKNLNTKIDLICEKILKDDSKKDFEEENEK